MDEAVEANPYRVRVIEREAGWEVQILGPGGALLFKRACDGEHEARTFASSIEQHIAWLSPARFRQYYRLGEPA